MVEKEEVNSLLGSVPSKRDLVHRKSGGLDVTPSYYSDNSRLGGGGHGKFGLGQEDGVLIVAQRLPCTLSRDEQTGKWKVVWNYDNYLGSRMNPKEMEAAGMSLRVRWIGTISVRQAKRA